MEIYADVLFFINFMMNYLLLWATAKFALIAVAKRRLLLGSALGAVYSIVILLPGFTYGNAFWVKLLFSLCLLGMVFYPVRRKRFLQIVGYFYFSSFLTGGTAIGLLYLKNERIHFTLFMMIGTIFFIVCFVLWMRRMQSKSRVTDLLALSILFAEQEVQILAMVDTGNQLRDPLSGKPVIVVEYEAVKNILPAEVEAGLHALEEKSLTRFAEVMSRSTCAERFHLIPFTSLGMSNGLLLGFRPDKMVLQTEGREIEKVIVGLYQQQFTQSGEYRALLHPELLCQVREK